MRIETETELVEKIHSLIHSFLFKRLGKDLINDSIDIFVEIDPLLGIDISIEIALEISPFSSKDGQKLSQEAIDYVFSKLDKEIQQYCDRIKKSTTLAS
ncbi:MAG: DUF3194 domain-containing protein [Promethearchaeota archaeon]